MDKNFSRRKRRNMIKLKKILKTIALCLLVCCFFILSACGVDTASTSSGNGGSSTGTNTSTVEDGDTGDDSVITSDGEDNSSDDDTGEDEGTYVLTFNANGGAGSMEQQIVPRGEATPIKKNTFTKTNYTFDGWSTSKTGVVEYADEESVLDIGAKDEVIELFAKWDKIPQETPTDPFENGTDLKLMSFNIRIGEKTDERMSAVVKNIQDVNPDVFGVQEADGGWISYLNTNLPAYSSVGEGRENDRTGETTTIFYRASDYTLLQSGTKWLTLSPNEPSLLDGGSEYKRILTFVKLQDKSTGAVFVHINAHLDYSSDEIARQQANIVAEYARLFKEYPTYITGDFNQETNSKTYQEMEKNGYLDSSFAAKTANRVGTFNGYNTDASKHSIIDYCFVSKNNVSVSKYDTWNKSAENGGHNGFISDHYAIYVESKIINTVTPSTSATTLNNTIFQCGDKLYGDVAFNTYGIDGVTASYENKTLSLTIATGKTLTLAGIKTASDVGLHVKGGGKLVVNGDITTNAFTTLGSVVVDVAGVVKANSADVGVGTTVNISVNAADAVVINGNMVLSGTLNLYNASNSYSGISMTKQSSTLTFNQTAKLRAQGFSYAIGAWYGGITLHFTTNVTWQTVGGYSLPKETGTDNFIIELSNIVKNRWNDSVTVS